MQKSFKKYTVSGFTLLELVLVIIILGVIAVTGSKMMVQGFQAAYSARDVTEVDWQLRVAIERMTRELRHVTSTGTMTSSPNTQITYIDTDGDTVTFAHSGSTITRTENGGSAWVLADGISALTFTYRDEDANTTLVTSNIKTISFDITVTQGEFTRTYRSTVMAPNIFF